MSLTLSYGYKLPQDGDSGASWFDDLEFDVQRLNDHTHDGVDSTLLSPAVITGQILNFATADWGSATLGLYSQTKTIPGSLTYDNTIKEARLANGDVAYLDLIRASGTTITVKTNDNSQDVNVAFK
jgi:hypothetical protein